MPENDIFPDANESADNIREAPDNIEDISDAMPETEGIAVIPMPDEDLLQLSFPIPGEKPEDGDADDDSETTEETDGEENAPDEAQQSEAKPRMIDSRFEFIELLIFTLVAVFVLTTFFFRHSIVDGESMINTLHHGDALIISNVFYTPKQYDIVVVEDHATGIDHPIVKRVIAVAGDKVQIRSNVIYVNDVRVRDDFVHIDNCNGPFGGYKDATFTVPEGEIYVLGDHRCNSKDSRDFGTVRADSVIGKVLFRFYPFADFGSVYTEAK